MSLEDGPEGRGYGVSDSLLFKIVHVEPVINDPVTRNVSLYIIFHVFLELLRQIAQPQVAFLIVSGNNFGTRAFLRIFLNPLSDLIVCCTAGDQRAKIVAIDFRKIQPALI